MKRFSPTPREFLEALRRRGLTVAVAESCTGGLVAHRLTKVAGASDVFWGGLVTYSNEAKQRFLGVSASTLAQWGAVSGQTALAMVQGLSATTPAPLVLSVTGIAGPTGGSPEKPVGTVWFGLSGLRSGRREEVAVCCRFSGSRSQIQAQAASFVLTFAIRWVTSDLDLDRLSSLTDNNENASFEAFLLPPIPPSHPF